MKSIVPYYVFLMHESDVKQGQTWNDVGIRYGMAMLLQHGEARLEWLNANLGGAWRLHVSTENLPRPAHNAAHEPSVRMHVDIEFDRPSDAVWYKLTWGGEEDS